MPHRGVWTGHSVKLLAIIKKSLTLYEKKTSKCCCVTFAIYDKWAITLHKFKDLRNFDISVNQSRHHLNIRICGT